MSEKRLTWDDLTPEQQEALIKWITDTLQLIADMITAAINGLADVLAEISTLDV